LKPIGSVEVETILLPLIYTEQFFVPSGKRARISFMRMFMLYFSLSVNG